MAINYLFVDDDVKECGKLTVSIPKVIFSVYGRELLSKRQYLLTKSKKKRVREKWLRVFDRRFAKLAKSRLKRCSKFYGIQSIPEETIRIEGWAI